MNNNLQALDQTDVESIALGYSASTLGIRDTLEDSFGRNKKSLIGSHFAADKAHHAIASVLSLNSVSVPTKPPIVLDKWYLQPVQGSKAIKVCGTKSINGSLHKSSAIQIRVSCELLKLVSI